MTHYKYIVVKGKPVVERDLLKWAMWIEKEENRVVKQDIIVGILVLYDIPGHRP